MIQLVKYFLLIIFSWGFLVSFAQDIQLSQTFANPTFLAPSFAGSTDGGRVLANYRNQWPSIPKAYITYMLAGDYYFSSKKSGLGALLIRDVAGEGTIITTNIDLQYSYNIPISQFWEIRPGIQPSFNFKNLDYSSLIFKDQLLNGGSVSSIENFPSDKIFYMDFSASLLAFSVKNWIGFNVDHLLKPEYTFINGENKMPIYYSLFGGTKLDINGGLYTMKDEYLLLNFLYKNQQKYDQLDLGVFLQREKLGFGFFYRGIPILKSYKKNYANNDALIVMAGYRHKNLNIIYSFDLSISRLFSHSGNAHEITLTYLFNQDLQLKKKFKKKIIDCPKFIDNDKI
ncbi:MAG: hypothetical protein A2046_03430 [Bacteroidetes bacterium GWA2_30_7]|nr:MAG: hypothetical protein A2046_03430 [Bacteroidetes bacterium GWA2_30_7]